MPTIIVPAPLKSLTGGQTRLEVEATTLGEAIDRLDERFPGLKARLVEDGRLRGGYSVFVDQELPRTGLATRLPHSCEVYISPVVVGGSACRDRVGRGRNGRGWTG